MQTIHRVDRLEDLGLTPCSFTGLVAQLLTLMPTNTFLVGGNLDFLWLCLEVHKCEMYCTFFGSLLADIDLLYLIPLCLDWDLHLQLACNYCCLRGESNCLNWTWVKDRVDGHEELWRHRWLWYILVVLKNWFFLSELERTLFGDPYLTCVWCWL